MNHITKDNYEELIEKSTKPTLLYFSAPWCGPCRAQGPLIEELSNELGESAVLGKVNVDEESDLTMKYGVRSIPALFIVENGVPTKKFVGLTQKETLKEALGIK